jgi:hypothetical protein
MVCTQLQRILCLDLAVTSAPSRVSSWQPSDLVERMLREPLDAFLQNIDATPYLVVRLDDFSNDLGAGLADADSVTKRKRLRDVSHATLHLSAAVTEQLRVARAASMQTVPNRMLIREAPPPARGFPAPELLSSKCYIVQLSTRSERPGPLSIGRDTTHNIVLLHPSVSSTHAFLTLGRETTLRDGPSRNGSFVNGVQVAGSVPVTVHAGDRIKLGAVQMVLCSAADLWQAAH